MGTCYRSSALTTFIIIFVFTDTELGFAAGQQFDRPCYHDIFCDGPLLHTVQLAEIFNDSKTFVDRPLRYPSDLILYNFEAFMTYHNNSPSKEDVALFVEYHFELPGTEFEEWNATDWHPEPAFLNEITDENLRGFARDLHNFWFRLGRKIKPEVGQSPDKYSLIYVPNGVVVPGGRFREFYYWDSYWIQEGLIKSEMTETVKGMIENFAHMVDQLGFVPNGGRVYFQRSQPPLLIPMVKNYIDATNDTAFLVQVLPTLEMEFRFWQVNRSVEVPFSGTNYTMFRYNSEKNAPRPESYKEDYLLAEGMLDEDKIELYAALHSGAESGIDFSSRWFVYNRNMRAADLIHTSTRYFVPADLNGYIYYNARLLADFHRELGNSSASDYYTSVAEELRQAINTVLWDEELGCWFDYNFNDELLHEAFFPTNLVPLWAGVPDSGEVIIRVLDYLRYNTSAFNRTALTWPGGVPSSLSDSGEQWDFPNAWAPLEDLVVEALDRSGNVEAQQLAFELAQTWVSTNYIAFYNSDPNHMYEKYNVTQLGLPGGGGEYEIVIGFGWTNGVILDFLSKYGDRLQAPELQVPNHKSGTCEECKDSGSAHITNYPVILLFFLFIIKLL